MLKMSKLSLRLFFFFLDQCIVPIFNDLVIIIL